MFCSRRWPTTRSTSAGGPARTTWCGQLSIATSTPAAPSRAAGRLDAVPVGGDGHQPGRRHVAGRLEAAEDRAEPAELALQLAIGPSTPAAARARISPLLWPTTASGRRPSRVSTWYSAHCAFRTTFTAVAVDQRPAAPSDSSARPNRCSLGGTVSPRSRAMRSAVSNCRRTSGKWRQRSASIPGYCDPLAGEQESQAARAAERLVPVIDAAAVADRAASGVGQAGQHGGEPSRRARRVTTPPGPAVLRPAAGRRRS